MAPVALPSSGGPSLPMGTAVAPAAPAGLARQQQSEVAAGSGLNSTAPGFVSQRSRQNLFVPLVVSGGIGLAAAIIIGALVVKQSLPQPIAQNVPAEVNPDEPQPIARTVESALPSAGKRPYPVQPKNEAKAVVPQAPAPQPAPPEPPAPMPTPMPAATLPPDPALAPPGQTPTPMPSAPTPSAPAPMPLPTPPAPPPPMATRAEIMSLIKALTTAREALAEQNFEEAGPELARAQTLAKLPQHQEAVARLKAVADYVKQFRDAVAAAVAEFQAGEVFMVGSSTQVAVVESLPDRVILRIAGVNKVYPFQDMPPGLAVAIADRKLDSSDPLSRVIKGAYLLVHKRADNETRGKAKALWTEAQAGGAEMAHLLPFLTDNYQDFLKDASEPANPAAR
jgi:hypothetical protein